MQSKLRWTFLLTTFLAATLVAVTFLAERLERSLYLVYAYAYQLASVLMLSILAIHYERIEPSLVFAYNCFVKPVWLMFKKQNDNGNKDESSVHQSRLQQFYEGQAHVYDTTRKRLLRGRSTMLKLCAAQLKQVFLKNDSNEGEVDRQQEFDLIPSPPNSPYLRPVEPSNAEKKIIWIDLGGGTGWNIETMNAFIPIDKFYKVYMVDITPSLCDVAKSRFRSLGWTNVYVKCMDVLKFGLDPEDLQNPQVEIALITMSYSLSMIETPFAIVDKVSSLLSPNGLVGVADFYVSNKRSPGDPSRQLSYFSRWFWQIWFDVDNVFLHPFRREYLEYKFVTIKSLSQMNRFIGPFVKIPYYIWIGAQPLKPSVTSESVETTAPPLSLGEPMMIEQHKDDKKMGDNLDFKHAHGQGVCWREPFDPRLMEEFSTYIYAFTWEDPKVDLKYLKITKEDEMLVLTSGGCNVLDYAIEGPKTIHAVDMNPCQGHLLELKLAALTSLDYEDFWMLFGEGCHPYFNKMLDTYLSPYLSQHAYQFWKSNGKYRNFYETGCSGLAIKAFRFLARLKGLDGAIKELVEAETLEKQVMIWEKKLRPHFLDRKWIGLLSNQKFAWDALGVPSEQLRMLSSEGSIYDYVVNTLDPAIRNSLVSNDNYFYHLCLQKRYSGNEGDRCPRYLTQDGFNKLKGGRGLCAIKIHTKAISEVLRDNIKPGNLSKAVVMDHMDWFNLEQAEEEIGMFAHRLCKGGQVYWRSASKHPWYVTVFERYGFSVKPLAIRVSDRESPEWQSLFQDLGDCLVNEFIDRVNMYASFWVATLQ